MSRVLVLLRAPCDKAWRSPGTYRRIEASLRRMWPSVRPLSAENAAQLQLRLLRLGLTPASSFIVNIGEYLDERHRRDFIPGLLDAWGYPHLGSTADAALLALDKAATKEVLKARGIPTPRFFVTGPEDPDRETRALAIGYPLFVKPVREGGHAGIGEDSIVNGREELERAVLRVCGGRDRQALVEEYITGDDMREFSVGVIGGTTRMHLPIEVDWEAMPVKTRILSHQAARRDLERVRLVREIHVKETLKDLAGRTFDAIGTRDYARVDIRANGAGYHVLEINAMPGLGPRSFLPFAARETLGWEYDDLIRGIVMESLDRQGLQIY